MTDAAVPDAGGAVEPKPAPYSDGFALGGWLTPVRIALILWAAMSLIAIVVNWQAIGAIDLSDTDDAMRLVTARDLIAGQTWFDTIQHRLNTPYGAELPKTSAPDKSSRSAFVARTS